MLKLVTSNEQKLEEFSRFNLGKMEVEKGRDLKEVESDELTVIVYKSLDAGTNRVVEDTSLVVEGADVGVNIRWMEDNLHTLIGRKAVWKVYLGLNDGEKIRIYGASVNGELVDAGLGKEFGFDGVFKPEGSKYTLHELSMMKRKDRYSARKKAVEAVKRGEVLHTYVIKDIPKWDGDYQQEEN